MTPNPASKPSYQKTRPPAPQTPPRLTRHHGLVHQHQADGLLALLDLRRGVKYEQGGCLTRNQWISAWAAQVRLAVALTAPKAWCPHLGPQNLDVGVLPQGIGAELAALWWGWIRGSDLSLNNYSSRSERENRKRRSSGPSHPHQSHTLTSPDHTRSHQITHLFLVKLKPPVVHRHRAQVRDETRLGMLKAQPRRLLWGGGGGMRSVVWVG